MHGFGSYEEYIEEDDHDPHTEFVSVVAVRLENGTFVLVRQMDEYSHFKDTIHPIEVSVQRRDDFLRVRSVANRLRDFVSYTEEMVQWCDVRARECTEPLLIHFAINFEETGQALEALDCRVQTTRQQRNIRVSPRRGDCDSLAWPQDVSAVLARELPNKLAKSGWYHLALSSP